MEHREPRRVHRARILDIIVVISMLSLPLMPLVIADPTLISMGPIDWRYTWEFGDLANYTLSNAVIENGTLRLAATPVSFSLTSQQDFENGTLTSPKTQEIYFWWFLLTTAAIAGLIALLAANRLMRKPFVVEDLMLIHNNGILLARSARGQGVKVDDDVFSGMLTAVLSFVEDSFKRGENEMKRFEFKDYSVAIQRGASSYVAVAYSGSDPKRFDKMMQELMAKIERIYGKRIENFSGDAAAELAGIDIVFNTFIHDYSKAPKNSEKPIQAEKS